MTDIALFGTSADPPTTGHQAIARWLSENFDWVAVWASDNPFKSHQASLEQRQTMLKLLIEEIEPPRHNISIHPELSSPRTLETLKRAKTLWPDAAFTVVIGSDLIDQLPSWYRIEELLQQAQLVVVPRSGYPVQDDGLEVLRRLGAKVAIAPLAPPDISSTAYRENGDTEALTANVQAYIYQEHLYTWQDATQKRLPIRAKETH